MTGLDAPGAGLSVASVESGRDTAGSTAVNFELSCADDYDVFLFSPELSFDTDAGPREQYLDPLRVGYTDLTAESMQRIADR